MNLNDLLERQGIDPRNVLIFRHRPHEPELRKILPWLAAERADVFNAYQQTQGERLERVMNTMVGRGFVASFIGHEPGQAVFIGLYSIDNAKPLTFDAIWRVPAYVEMKSFGMKGWHTRESNRKHVLWFDLKLLDFYTDWKGKLIIRWPPPERSWWRRAHRNEMAVVSICEESLLARAMPEWDDLVLSWAQLKVLPSRWKSALSQWRGIYYIFDSVDGKGYVGAAYGGDNLLGRWTDYAARGHGGNRLLRRRNPASFQFSILQRVSPDLEARDAIRLETSWKRRLHTYAPDGLNDN